MKWGFNWLLNKRCLNRITSWLLLSLFWRINKKENNAIRTIKTINPIINKLFCFILYCWNAVCCSNMLICWRCCSVSKPIFIPSNCLSLDILFSVSVYALYNLKNLRELTASPWFSNILLNLRYSLESAIFAVVLIAVLVSDLICRSHIELGAFRKLVSEKATYTKILDVARKNGMDTLFENGLKKIEEGITSFDEVISVTTLS